MRGFGQFYSATLVYGFILSLSTYPLENFRLSLAGLEIPYSVVPLVAMLLGLLGGLVRTPVVGRDSVALGLLVFSLVVSTVVGAAMYGFAPSPDRLKGLVYFLIPLVLVRGLRDRSSRFVLLTLALALVIPVSVGWFRFFSGTGGIVPEHAIGYWGIRYLPATRNSDVLYPLALSALALFGAAAGSAVSRSIFFALFVFGAAAVAMSLSRGAWFSLAFITVLFVIGRGVSGFIVGVSAVVLAVALLLQFAPDEFVVSIVDRFFTLVSMNDTRVSNGDRVGLIMDSLSAIFANPLGVGFGNMGYVVGRDGVALWNSENGWLTIGIEGGWPSIFLSFYLTASLMRRARQNVKSMGRYLAPALFVYLIFNYELNSAFMWGLIAFCWYERENRRFELLLPLSDQKFVAS